jgi:iron-sulfur cluster repair protein YtfE (RIC family)
MNAIEMLIREHEEVANMFDELENTNEDQITTAGANTPIVQARIDLFRKLKNALTMHSREEEQVFYPALENFDETRDLITEAYREHGEVEQMLEEISALNPTDEQWLDKIIELRENVEHHVAEEEDELFPQVEELFNEQKLQQIGAEMEAVKNGRAATTTA